MDLFETRQLKSCVSVFESVVWVAIRYRCSLIQVPALRDAEIKMLPTRHERSHQGVVQGTRWFTHLSARDSLGGMDETGRSSQFVDDHGGNDLRLKSDKDSHGCIEEVAYGLADSPTAVNAHSEMLCACGYVRPSTTVLGNFSRAGIACAISTS